MEFDLNEVRLNTEDIQCEKLKQKLDEHKHLLDRFDKPTYKHFKRKLDNFRSYRRYLHRCFNIQNPTNAWLKCFEVLSKYKIIENLIRDNITHNFENSLSECDKIVTFHNAEFPGSFILATQYYISSILPLIFGREIKHEWLASSFNDENQDTLSDSYNLFKNYRERWTMNEGFNGDVINSKYLYHLENKFHNSIDFYTSDLGFNTPYDQDQEIKHAQYNLGQILSGLLLLKKRGVLLTKQYTMFTPFTRSLMVLLTQLFESVKIIKPLTSRPLNSEVYVFASGFKGLPLEIKELLFERLENFNLTFLDKVENDFQVLENLDAASSSLTESQCERIEHLIWVSENEKRYDFDFIHRRKEKIQFENICKLQYAKTKLNIKEINF